MTPAKLPSETDMVWALRTLHDITLAPADENVTTWQGRTCYLRSYVVNEMRDINAEFALRMMSWLADMGCIENHQTSMKNDEMRWSQRIVWIDAKHVRSQLRGRGYQIEEPNVEYVGFRLPPIPTQVCDICGRLKYLTAKGKCSWCFPPKDRRRWK